jgi:hypothetical protein
MFLGCPKCKFMTNKMTQYRRHQFFHHVHERKRKRYLELNPSSGTKVEHSGETDAVVHTNDSDDN